MDKSLKKIIQLAIAAIALLALITTTVVFAKDGGFIKLAFDDLIGTPTAGADDIVSKYIEDIEVTPIASEAGLFDADNNLVCSWESLVNDYGMTFDVNEVSGFHEYVEGGKTCSLILYTILMKRTGNINHTLNLLGQQSL